MRDNNMTKIVLVVSLFTEERSESIEMNNSNQLLLLQPEGADHQRPIEIVRHVEEEEKV